jgi:large subunit ribosomal protein L5
MPTSNLKLKEKYQKEIALKLKDDLGIKNIMAVPKILKVVINAGLGRKLLPLDSNKAREEMLNDIKENMKLITGQMPVETKAKKSIASFKSRQGNIIGLKTTLRGNKMYDFIDRLVRYVLPRVRDFRGLPLKSIDKQGNLNIGIREVIVFPEFPPASSRNMFGLQITIVPEVKNKEQAIKLFSFMGFPLKKEEK